MFTGEPCKVGAPQFENGTTNGAAWYPLTGGMQDYNYIWHGCMEVTLELSCCKFPPASELQVVVMFYMKGKINAQFCRNFGKTIENHC